MAVGVSTGGIRNGAFKTNNFYYNDYMLEEEQDDGAGRADWAFIKCFNGWDFLLIGI